MSVFDGIQNAQIENVSIFVEGHGILTGFVDTTSGSSSQGFGGYDLRDPERLGAWVQNLMRVFGTYDSLKGTPCRIKIEDGLIRSIGHFIEDKWFTPKTDLPWNEPS